MRLLIGLFFLSAISCGSDKEEPSRSSSDTTISNPNLTNKKIQTPDSTSLKETDNYEPQDLTDQIDSTELIKFWNQTAIPIIKKQKAVVIKRTNFPLEGEWYQMVTYQGMSDSKADFLKVYDKLFTSEVRNLISEQTYKDVGVIKQEDFVEYTFGFGKDFFDKENNVQIGGGSVIMRYRMINDTFKLYSINGAGGNFYDME